jgi:hypothetical protein
MSHKCIAPSPPPAGKAFGAYICKEMIFSRDLAEVPRALSAKKYLALGRSTVDLAASRPGLRYRWPYWAAARIPERNADGWRISPRVV